MIKVKSERILLAVNFKFASPLYNWNVIPTRFFEMVHSALTPDFAISSKDFSNIPSHSLADVAVKFNLFGGPNSVELSADNLSFKFENLLPNEIHLALQIIEKIDSGFLESFPNCQISTIQVTSFVHATIVNGASITDYLNQFTIQSVEKVCSQTGADHMPIGKFIIRDTEWFAICSVEKSEIFENALFLNWDVQLLNVSETDNFQEKLNRFSNCISTCALALNLEPEYVF